MRKSTDCTKIEVRSPGPSAPGSSPKLQSPGVVDIGHSPGSRSALPLLGVLCRQSKGQRDEPTRKISKASIQGGRGAWSWK